MDCLSPDAVGGVGVGVGRGCWMGGYSEDEDELLPLERCPKEVRKVPALQPKSEGSLRRRLLTSKIHQQRDALWAPRPLAQGPQDSKDLQRPLPRQGYPYPQGSQGHTQGYSHSLAHLRRTSYSPPTPNQHPGFSFPPTSPTPSGAGSYTQTGPCGYSNFGPSVYTLPGTGLPGYSLSCPGYCNPAYNTSPSSSPRAGAHTPAHRPSFSYPHYGYSPQGLAYGANSSPLEPGHISNLGLATEAQPGLSSRRKSFSCLNLLRKRSSKARKMPSPHTPLLHAQQRPHWRAVGLDEDRKWSVHYSSQKPQQETRLTFKDDLHIDLRECDRNQRNDGYGSSHYFSQNPAYLSPSLSEGRLHNEKDSKDQSWKKRSKLLDYLYQSCFSVCWRRKSTASSPDEDCLAFSFRPPPSPPPNCYRNINDTVNGCDVTANGCDLTVGEDAEWIKTLPLPTPEEKMRQQALAIGAEVVPINITGESFERQASFRRALANTDTLSRRPRNKLTRRKTITGIPDDITRIPESQPVEGCGGSVVLPGQYSTVGRTGSVHTAMRQCPLTQSHTPSNTPEADPTEEEKNREENQRVVKASVRRIRAQRGQGISSLMASLTPTLTPNPSLMPQTQAPPSLSLPCSPSEAGVSLEGDDGGEGLRSLLHQDTTSSLGSESSCLSSPYGTLCDAESCSTEQDLQSHSEEGWKSRSQCQSTSLVDDWSYEPLLPSSHSSPLHPISSPSSTDCSSLCSENTDSTRHSPLQRLKSHSHGCISVDYATGSNDSAHCNPDHDGLSSGSLSHSISLRKSKKPPPPPTRSTSLCRDPSRGKPPRSSFNRASGRPEDGDDAVLRSPQTPCLVPLSPTVSPGLFGDPWVPRCSSLSSLGKGVKGGADTSRQIPHFHSFHHQPSPGEDQDHPACPNSQQPLSLPPVTRSASIGGVSMPTRPTSGHRVVAAAWRHQSPASSASSGYSSQCNTPTTSSPRTPSSPLTSSSSLPLTASSALPHTTYSSLPRTRSKKDSPKPPVPERKSSLLSSPSSSFSSTSSLSSFTSSDSVRNPPLPPSTPLPCSSAPPPLPPPYQSLPQQQSLHSPPPHPVLPTLPPPSYTYALQHAQPQPFVFPDAPDNLEVTGFPPPPSPELAEESDLSISCPPPPPPPPPPYTHTPPSHSQVQSISRVSLRQPPRPLITTQALQRVTLRSVKRAQELAPLVLPSIVLTNPISADVEQSLDCTDTMLTSIIPTDALSTNYETMSVDNECSMLNDIMLTSVKERVRGIHALQASSVSDSVEGIDTIITEAEAITAGAVLPICQKTNETNDSPPAEAAIRYENNGAMLIEDEMSAETLSGSCRPYTALITAWQTDATTEETGRKDSSPQITRTLKKPNTLDKPRVLEKLGMPEMSKTAEKPVVLPRPLVFTLKEVVLSSSPPPENREPVPQNIESMLQKETSPRLTSGQSEYSRKADTPTHSPASPSSSPQRQKPPATLQKPKRSFIMKGTTKPQAESHPVNELPIQRTTKPQAESHPMNELPIQRTTKPQTESHPKLELPKQRTTKTKAESQPEPELPTQRTTKPKTESQTFYHSKYYVPELPPKPCLPKPHQQSCRPEFPQKSGPPEPKQESCFTEPKQESCFTEPKQESCFTETKQESCFTETKQESCFTETKQESCFTEPKQESCFTEPKQESCFTETKQESCFTETKQGSCFKESNQESLFTEPKQGSCFKEPKQESCFKEPKQESCFKEPKPEFCFTEPKQESSLPESQLESSTLKAKADIPPGHTQRVQVSYAELETSELHEIWVMQKNEEDLTDWIRETGTLNQRRGEEEEGDEEERGATEDEDSSDSGSFLLEERRDSLSSDLSTDSLKEELLLPNSLIHEEVISMREEVCGLDTDGVSSSTGSLSSRQDNRDITSVMVTPARPRTTEDLFAAIHRSKRKVLGRRKSVEEPCPVFPISSSSHPVTSTDPGSTPPRPLEVIGFRSTSRRSGVRSSSDGFKALLLKKGSRRDPATRISAAERLRSTAPRHQGAPAPQNQSSQSETQSEAHMPLVVEPHARAHEASPHTPQPSPLNAHKPYATPHADLVCADKPPYRHRRGRKAEWSPAELLFPPSSPTLWSWRPPRSPTPPCSASRRFASRSRLLSSPMTAISEWDGEEDDDSTGGKAPAKTTQLAGGSYEAFELVSLTDGQDRATNGSLDWLDRRTTNINNMLFSFPFALSLESSG
ncbi:NHS-like protein 1 isoform X2 [Esox lucius]|uniref:NHS-like protein 1 isoform X2 n=1 Tax=Esox lucius TaxID=8010 RepID=UPI0014769EBA|nr:NHS-like protein 1 isoform X2 [Esox lucius]